MPLPTPIQKQKDYMTDALRELLLIEEFVPIVDKWDPVRAKVYKESCERNYADIMSMLFENMAMVEPTPPQLNTANYLTAELRRP